MAAFNEFIGEQQSLKQSFSSLEVLDASTDRGFMSLSNRILFHDEQANFPASFSAAGSAGRNNNSTPVLGSVLNLSPSALSGTGLRANNKGKRKRNDETDMLKPKEVVHVRAKRGQATDSHSLAERVRREKINEKLRCLQDLVPGCYKTMGMAVMLDVIINYVQSLQNQIEFLSMKLSAASMYCDLNLSDMDDAIETMQGSNAYEVQEMEKMAREGYGGLSHFNSIDMAPLTFHPFS